jgi:hypothetical protein
MNRVSSDQHTAGIKRRGRDDQISIVLGMPSATGQDPQIGRAIKDGISNR